jgi:hypothetical protein
MYFMTGPFYQLTTKGLLSFAMNALFGSLRKQIIEETFSLLELHLAERPDRRN